MISMTMYACPCGARYSYLTLLELHQLSACERRGYDVVSASASCLHGTDDASACPQCAAVVVAAARGQVERVA